MSEKENRAYISNLIDIKKQIEPYQLTMIHSGVGSGKNTFITGWYDEDNKNQVNGLAKEGCRVLLITSRRAKVVETIKDDKEDSSLFIEYKDEEDFGVEAGLKSIICTNALIENKIKNSFKLGDSTTYFWREFDYIVVDEYHSLVTDATFSNSGYYVAEMIKFILTHKDKRNPKIILMSGTPEPVEEYFMQYKPNKIDLLKQATFLKPKQFVFISRDLVQQKLCEALRKNKTTVYFKNRLNDINTFIKGILDAKEVFPSIETEEKEYTSFPQLDSKERAKKIAVAVSSKSVNKKINEIFPEIKDNSVKYIDVQAAKEEIPNDIKLVITNAKSKEGININSKVDCVYIESHVLTDIIQMSGRFRAIEEVSTVYLIYDAPQFIISERNFDEKKYQLEYLLDKHNEYKEEIIKGDEVFNRPYVAHQHKVLEDYIEYIEEQTNYVKYNPFSLKFECDELFSISKEYYKSSIDNYMRNYHTFSLHKWFFDKSYSEYFNKRKVFNTDIPSRQEGFIAMLRNKFNIETGEYFDGRVLDNILSYGIDLGKKFYGLTEEPKISKLLEFYGCAYERKSKSHKKETPVRILVKSDKQEDVE